MNVLFLLNDALFQNNYESFKDGFKKLFLIEALTDDLFLKHNSFWELEFVYKLYNDFTSQDEGVICSFIEQKLKNSDKYFKNSDELNKSFSNHNNGFLGHDFSQTEIELEKQVIDNESYFNFINCYLSDVNFKNFWIKKNEIFPNLIMCGEVKSQINLIGNSSYFNQIILRLKELDRAVEEWNSGKFNYSEINKNYSLRISPESSLTMSRYGNERRFQLPQGGTGIFEFHIKTGDLRFHFLPDEINKKVYIGYIGAHLPTVSN